MAGLLWPTAAVAQATKCIPAQTVEAQLKNQYGESVVSLAVNTQGNLVELWQAPSGAWTLLVRKRESTGWVLCPLMSGRSWHGIPGKQGAQT